MLKSPAKQENTSQELIRKQDETEASKITTPSKEKRILSTPSKSQSPSTDTNIKQSLVKSVEKLHAFARKSPSKPVSKTTDSTKPSSGTKTVIPEKQKSQTKASLSNLPTKTNTDKKSSPNGKTVTPEKLTHTPKSKSSTLTSVDTKKPSPSGKSKTPETPKAQTKSTPGKAESKAGDADLIPSSLERKSSAYRSFMMRDGPQALGSKEIPRVTSEFRFPPV